MPDSVRSGLTTKIYVIAGFLSLVIALVGAVGVWAMTTYQDKVAAINSASDRAVLGERINGLVLAVVMDSRGIYMARDAKEVEKFSPPLLDNLKKIDTLMARWASLVPADQRVRVDAAITQARQFVEFRTELVRLGRQEGAAAARTYGDNDANRSNRQAFNKALQELVEENDGVIDRLERELVALEKSALILMGALGIGGVVVGFGATVWGARRFITGPIRHLTGAMQALAAGDLSADIPARDRGDEVGEMARAVVVFKDSMARELAMEAEQRRTIQQREERQAQVEGLVREFASRMGMVTQSLSGEAQRLRQEAEVLSQTANEGRSQSTLVASSAAEATSNVETVAAATEELSASIREIAQRMGEASRVTAAAEEQASRTNATIQGLASAAERIGEVVNLISAIASQTNLLALNATIEAARAGEAGKGFAVVASEVKNLANQTGKATEDIQAQVAAIQAETQSAVEAIGHIVATISQISGISQAVAAAVEEQGSATGEIARNVQEASSGTMEVSHRIAGVAQAAERTGQSAQGMLRTAETMSQETQALHDDVESFVGRLRAL